MLDAFSALDLFESNAGYNGYILGGRGKNILIDNIIMDCLHKNVKIFILDSNKEHLRLVDNLGGKYISFNSKNLPVINPFSYIKTEYDFREHMDYLIRFLYIIGVSSENTNDDLNKDFRAHILTALYTLWEENKRIEISDIYKWFLRQNYKGMESYIKNFEPFLPEGKYGNFFSGELASTLAFGDESLLAVDFSDLAFDHRLKAFILMVVIIHVYRNFYHDSRQTIIFFNQFKEFAQDLPNAYILIESLYREARRHNISIVTAIETIKDLYEGDKISRAGRIILINSEWKFFLQQIKIESSAEEMSNKLCSYISDTEFNLIKSLKYNDVYIKSNANFNGGFLTQFC